MEMTPTGRAKGGGRPSKEESCRGYKSALKSIPASHEYPEMRRSVL
jgi:hypothetical protein